LNSTSYSFPVDIWAAGCILAEMFLSRPLFPGTSVISQLDMIFSVCGRPKELPRGCTIEFIHGLGNPKAEDMMTVIPNGTEDANDLITLMLQVQADRRITASEALEHPFVSRFHDPDAEPEAKDKIALTLSCGKSWSVNECRDFLYAEVVGRQSVRRRLGLDDRTSRASE
jgi:serine/threonine protein kinase